MSFLTRFKWPSRTNKDGKLPDFAGKILVIYPVQERIGGGMFQDAKAVRIGPNVFVVGRRVGLEPPLSQERWSRATVWTSMHMVAQMLVFEDLESARLAFESDWDTNPFTFKLK